jgi:spore coat polysaccharide biosynthesis protein SpsF
MRTIAIIQARMGSARLPGKLARRLGHCSLLETVVRRAKAARRVSGVVVATSDRCEDEAIEQFVPGGVPIVAGPADDVLGRFLRVLELFPADLVVRVCADNPYIDPSLIDRLVEHAGRNRAADYVSFRCAGGTPTILTGLGLFAEVVRTSALRRAADSTTDPCDREHVTRFIYRHPDQFSLCYLPVPTPLDREDLRLTVDFPEDWQHVRAIYESLGPEPLEWQEIVDYVARRERLRRRMASLNALCPKS